MSSRTSARRPEVLAPAGDEASLRAAVRAGADAVYFGLQGFNARARAKNFDAQGLARTMDYLHANAVRGYVTLNTLVFDAELASVEAAVRACAEAGVDAVIVQDLGVARLVRAMAPGLPIHASTQMTCTDAGAVELAREAGASRVILARELSVEDIAAIREETDVELEVFVHGALCVAYSGQCLTSEALGGRSANRGACAQACRLPYELVVDGETRDLGDRAFANEHGQRFRPQPLPFTHVAGDGGHVLFDLAAHEVAPVPPTGAFGAQSFERRLHFGDLLGVFIARLQSALAMYRVPDEVTRDQRRKDVEDDRGDIGAKTRADHEQWLDEDGERRVKISGGRARFAWEINDRRARRVRSPRAPDARP